MDLSHVNLALLIWMLLAIVASGISFFLTYPNPICVFHVFYCCMNFGGIIVYLIGFLDDLTEDSTDWGERSPALTGNWTLIGLSLLFVISLFLGFVFGKFTPSFWVPQELYPLELEEVGTLLPFMMTLFGTWFSVVAGEEGMKITLSAFYKVYEHSDLQLPFALHPARLLANGVWSVMHVLKGQYPFTFFFSVFASGTVMDSASAQSGTILTNYFIHALFNSLLLIASFLMGGALTIVW